MKPQRYRIVSRLELPARMQGEKDYRTAYALVCEWNRKHNAADMAVLERVNEKDNKKN